MRRLFFLGAILWTGMAFGASVPISYDEPDTTGQANLAYTSIYWRYGNCSGRDFQAEHKTRATDPDGGGSISTTVRVPLRADLLPVNVCFCVSATDVDLDESACNTTAVSGDNPKTFSVP